MIECMEGKLRWLISHMPQFKGRVHNKQDTKRAKYPDSFDSISVGLAEP